MLLKMGDDGEEQALKIIGQPMGGKARARSERATQDILPKPECCYARSLPDFGPENAFAQNCANVIM